MSVKATSHALFFVSEQHQSNYEQLQSRFKSFWSSEYAAGAYIAALPEVFYRIKWDDEDSPLSWYFGEWVVIKGDNGEEDGFHNESEIVTGLSSSYKLLVRAGVELFTGRLHKFDLQHFLGNADDKLYRVFLQLLEIRRKSSILNLAGETDPEDGEEF
ncbi:hypothetical protein CDO73_26140 [Saccharibacillus sp. O23]|uniref:DUF2538 family protein n=1 Tax=Saccharibacillus sp. O23 TaxID=2009338 RepID=UPI000B4E5CD1|nr:DUF2538 family protein [Saccharibacillus sp. O23]OWR25662.1 hypothetical protein CDO73_26140 [Saccharibacillus sp. O23]